MSIHNISSELETIREHLAAIKNELAYVERQIQLLIVQQNYGKIEFKDDANRIDTLGANY